MKKRLLVIVYLCFISVGLTAQFTLISQVPPSGVILKPQLWNAVITNSYPDTKQIFLGLTLSDAVTGEPILTATTTLFLLETGAIQVNESNLSPINYEYLSSRVVDRGPDGYLPVGNYTACYRVSAVDENGRLPSLEECIPVIVEPVSPPILNTPPDKEILETQYPQFTWIPPTPIELFSNLNYEFVLVEEQPLQSAFEAIQQNLPIYSSSQTDLYLNYPSSASPLDTGKMYAWKIIAKNNDDYTAESEVWEFKIGSDSTFELLAKDPLPFVILKRKLDATISDCQQILKFIYSNTSESDSVISFTISALGEDNLGAVIKQGTLLVHNDENYISIPLSEDNSFLDGSNYLLMVTNSKQEQWKLKFMYHNSRNQ